MTRDQIFTHVTDLMYKLFELETTEIKPESELQKDLDIDSIDAVDLMLELKNLTGEKVSPEAFHEVKTVQDVVITLERLMQERELNLEKTPE
ncbi:MAG: acyl carrier protein [Cellvibrionaceae bacterium]|nr:acyl carrier protein [Cellvibrionaceae bacterium]